MAIVGTLSKGLARVGDEVQKLHGFKRYAWGESVLPRMEDQPVNGQKPIDSVADLAVSATLMTMVEGFRISAAAAIKLGLLRDKS